jgi:sugar lactone lactonase YvrE
MRRSRAVVLSVLLLAPLGAFLACRDDDNAANSTGPDASTGSDQSSPTGDSGGGGNDAGGDGGIQRGPATLDFDPQGNGDPISLLWEDAKQTLYIADNRNNQLWTWTDKDSFKKLATVPNDADGGPASLGQIVKLPDGTLVVPRFGGGENGAIVHVNPETGQSGTVPGLAADRKRVALTVGPDGQMYGGYFFNPQKKDDAGVVTKVTLTGETDLIKGFLKPVSVLVVDNRLLVSEQARNGGVIYSFPTTGGTDQKVFAVVPSPDTITEGPGGSVFTGQFRPLDDGGPLQVRQAFPDGGVQVVHANVDFAKPQGVAYDKSNKRLFVADSNGTTVRTLKILPID